MFIRQAKQSILITNIFIIKNKSINSQIRYVHSSQNRHLVRIVFLGFLPCFIIYILLHIKLRLNIQFELKCFCFIFFCFFNFWLFFVCWSILMPILFNSSRTI